MKNIKYILCSLGLLILISAGLSGCGGTKKLPPVTTEITTADTIKEVARDTFFVTEKDSSFYKALLECQEGKVVLKQVIQNKGGTHLKIPSVNLKDNTLSVDCYAEAQKLFAKWKENHTSKTVTKIVREPYPVEREWSTFETVQIWCGRLFILIALFGGSWLLYKGLNPVK